MTIEGILVPIVMFDIFESDDLLKMADYVFKTQFVDDGQEPEAESEIPDQI